MTKWKQKNKQSYFDLIPFDLFISILSRLPVKSKAQCRCVSKLWSSLIRFPNYNQLFPIKSPALPRLLFAVKTGSKLSFYSSPQPQNPDKDLSLVPTQHHTYLGKDLYSLCRPVRGLVCSHHTEKKYSWAVITNPITGEYVTTPKVTGDARYSFGYDPIDKNFKVLRITWLYLYPNPDDNLYAEYHVLTLGTGHRNLLWRKMQCCTFHSPLKDNGICINGVLYYPATTHNQKHTIVCFDIRPEKFCFINIHQDMATNIWRPFILINYKGKLGVSGCSIYSRYFALWVLENAEKHIWLRHIYITPHKLPVGRTIAGMTGSGGIVLYRFCTQDLLFISYYNLEKNIITTVRLEVPVLDESNYYRVYTFANYEEDVKLM